MTETVTSKNGVTIRLTDERWIHITEEHAELAGYKWDVLETVSDPEVMARAGLVPPPVALLAGRLGWSEAAPNQTSTNEDFVRWIKSARSGGGSSGSH